jgi:hypothetical protein
MLLVGCSADNFTALSRLGQSQMALEGVRVRHGGAMIALQDMTALDVFQNFPERLPCHPSLEEYNVNDW